VSLHLRKGQLASLGADARVLRCRAGVVWVTREGDARDYVLRTGEELRLEKGGRVVVQAILDAEVRVLDFEPGRGRAA
jgi:hypothetical protein